MAVNDELLLGWYAGTKRVDVMSDLTMLVSLLALGCGVALEDTVLYGSSAGGFAAMMVAPRLGGRVTAVAINPQTRIIKYVENSVLNFVKAAYPRMSPLEAEETYPERFSAINVWGGGRRSSARLFLLQNALDGHHYVNHFLPFIHNLGLSQDYPERDESVKFLVFEDKRGHSGVDTKQMLPDILEFLSEW